MLPQCQHTQYSPRIEVIAVKYFHAIPKKYVTGHNQKIHTNKVYMLTKYDYNYILEKISFRDKTEYERYVEVYSDDKEK